MKKSQWVVCKSVKIDRNIDPQIIRYIKSQISIPNFAVGNFEELVESERRRIIEIFGPNCERNPRDSMMELLTRCGYTDSFLGTKPCFAPNPFVPYGILGGSLTVEDVNNWYSQRLRTHRFTGTFVETRSDGFRQFRKLLKESGLGSQLEYYHPYGFSPKKKGVVVQFETTGYYCNPQTAEIEIPRVVAVIVAEFDPQLRDFIQKARWENSEVIENFRRARFRKIGGAYEVFEKDNYRFTKDPPEVPW